MSMIQFDYDSILSALRDNLTSIMEDANIARYSASQKILEAVAEELQSLAQYTEYLTRESKWSLCQNLSSIMTQATMFGYKVHRKTGAVGSLQVSASPTFSGSYPYPVTIPKFSQFSNGDLTFASSSEIILSATDKYVYVPIVQGAVNTYEETISTTDDTELTNYTVHIDGDSIEDTLYEVRVNGILFTEVENFAQFESQSFARTTAQNNASSSGSYFVLTNDSDMGGVTFTFGDGITATRLNRGDTIEITYLVTEGADGNVTSSETITKALSQGTSSRGDAVTLYCRNIDDTQKGVSFQVSGGGDAETIDEIRELAPSNFREGNSILTRSDYMTKVSEILSGTDNYITSVWGWEQEQESNNLPSSNGVSGFADTTYLENETNFYGSNRVHITGVYIDVNEHTATALTNEQENKIVTGLQDVKPLTDVIWFEEPLVTYFKARVRAFYDSSLYTEPSTVISDVNEALMNSYAFDTVNLTRYDNRKEEFGNNLYYSEYYALIHDLESVAYHNMYIRLFQYHTFSENSTTGTLRITGFDTGFNYIKPNSIYIYVRRHDSEAKSDWCLFAVDYCSTDTADSSTNGRFITVYQAMNDSTYSGRLTSESQDAIDHTTSVLFPELANVTVSTYTSATDYFNYVTGAFDPSLGDDFYVEFKNVNALEEDGTTTDVTGSDYDFRFEFLPEGDATDIVMTKRNMIMGISSTDISIIAYPIGTTPSADEAWADVWDGVGVDTDTDEE